MGEYLLATGAINQLQLEYAQQKNAIEGGKLGSTLIKHGLVSESKIAHFLATRRKIPFVDVTRLAAPAPEVFTLFNRDLCITHKFLPLARVDGALEVVLGDGEPETVAELVQRRTGLKQHFSQGEFTPVLQAIRQHFYFAQQPVEELLAQEARRLADDSDMAYSPEKMLDHLLHLAVYQRATDIHIAPATQSLHILFRVDGVLRPMFALPQVLERLLTFVKLSAEMDVAEKRLPQDGSFNATILEMSFTLRVSTLISEHGERMVLRILPDRNELGGLEDLGYQADDVALLREVFARPAGLILITGPTGSGKSTTLHAALRMQSLIERNVLTIEDPVEYIVPGACQTEVNRRAGYDFGTVMRHFLRHDPDVMLIGEIRDSATAQAAMDAASTGHLVVSTMHVGSIYGVVPRLQLLAIDSETIAENLVTVINQRLIRRICPHCKTTRPINARERGFFGADAPATVAIGRGCDTCHGSGYLGRLPVYEMILVSPKLADAIGNTVPRQQLREIANASGHRPMIDMARWLALQGETTVDEIQRSVGGI
jgi:general secretion pathway protein E